MIKRSFHSLLESGNVLALFTAEERRLAFQALVVGVVVWGAVFTLRGAVHWLFEHMVTWLEAAPSPFVVFLPLAGGALIVATLVRYRSHVIHYRDSHDHIHELVDVEGDGLERAISLYFSSEPALENALSGREGVDVRWQLPTFSLATRKFLATMATLGSGGSGGLEASVTLIGESVAAGLFKPRLVVREAGARLSVIDRFWNWWSSTDPDNLQAAQLSGIAAAVSTLLNAPFAGAFFASEVMYRRRPIVEKLVYSLIAALTAFFLDSFLGRAHGSIFHVDPLYVPPETGRYYLILMFMAVAVALFSNLFSRLRNFVEDSFHHRIKVVWQRHLLGAFITGAVALTVYYSLPWLFKLGLPGFDGELPVHRLSLVLGPGEEVIDAALAGELVAGAALVILVGKLLATLATIGSGGSAGLLVPSIFFGTMIATVFSRIFDVGEAMVLVIPAITASLVSIANVPLAAILFTVEAFGARYMVPSLIVLVVASIFSQELGIYRTQRETYDSRQLLPGYSVRRVVVPGAWAGRTLIDLDIRRRFQLNVIGFISHDEEAAQQVRFEPPSDQPLAPGDILVVLGEDRRLDRFMASLSQE